MRLPKYRRHSSGVGFVEWKGRRHYFKGHAFDSPASKSAYNDFLRENVLKAEQTVTTSTTSVLTVFQKYLIDLIENGTKSERYHFTSISELLQKHAAQLPINDLGPVRLKSIREDMVKRKWSRGYVNEQTQRIRRIVKWAVANELAKPETLSALQAVEGLRKGRTAAPEPRKVKPAPLRDVARVLRVAPPTLAAMIRTHWRIGMRPHHLCAMRPIDLDMTSIEGVWVYRPVHHEKGAEDAELLCIIGPRTQKILQPFLDRDEKAYLFDPRQALLERGRKPSRRVRNHYDTGSYRQALYKLAKRCGAAQFHPHQLRHSAGTNARALAGLEGAQAYLGHAHADVTQIYAEKNLQLAIDVARRIG